MISILLPVHNEGGVLLASVAKLKAAMDAAGMEYEMIISEDGSSDNSRAVAGAVAKGNIRLLSAEKRLGRGMALSNAISAARGDIVVYMDADLATDLGHVPQLVSAINAGADIATGSRYVPGAVVSGRGAMREFLSRGYNLLLRVLFRTSVSDHQCGFKAFRRSAILPILSDISDNHWFWDSELLIRAQKKGLKVAELPVRWADRRESRVNLGTDIVSMGLAALRLRLSLR